MTRSRVDGSLVSRLASTRREALEFQHKGTDWPRVPRLFDGTEQPSTASHRRDLGIYCLVDAKAARVRSTSGGEACDSSQSAIMWSASMA